MKIPKIIPVIGPCPYCGRPGYITECLNHPYITANHKKKCLMKPDTWMISDKSLKKQIKAWNMRWKGKENE